MKIGFATDGFSASVNLLARPQECRLVHVTLAQTAIRIDPSDSASELPIPNLTEKTYTT